MKGREGKEGKGKERKAKQPNDTLKRSRMKSNQTNTLKTQQNAILLCYLVTLYYFKKHRETTHKVIVDPGVKPSWGCKIVKSQESHKILNFMNFWDFHDFAHP